MTEPDDPGDASVGALLLELAEVDARILEMEVGAAIENARQLRRDAE